MSVIKGFIYEDELAKARRVTTKQKERVIIPIVLIPTPSSEYSDYMIKEDVTMEESDAGKEGVILGNASIKIKRVGMKISDRPQND